MLSHGIRRAAAMVCCMAFALVLLWPDIALSFMALITLVWLFVDDVTT